MISSSCSAVEWKFAVLPALAIVFVSLIPQLHFWVVRGSHWNGAYAILQGDETYYSAYINALIDGRPRRNDPFTGQDDHPQARMSESLFSIQFVPPYAIAFFARTFGISASTAFIVLVAAVALLASLSVFWLLASTTGDVKFAAVGVIVVLCLGTGAGGQGWIGLILKPDTMFGSLLFLRRYLPSAPFPFFFIFCALIFESLTIARKRAATVRALVAGLAFSVLVFSYFYLWTAALAWLVCIACLWLVMRPVDRRASIRVFLILSTLVVTALVFYGYMLSHLPPALDKAQVLTLTHQPDLLRIPEIIGAIILALLLAGARQNKIQLSEPQVIFAASFALLPFLVFNQQIITGRSIQPYHYEIFITNYVVLIGLVILIKLLRPRVSRRGLIVTASLCLLWGAIEVNQQFKIRSTFDVSNDEMVPVLLRLKELATQDGTLEGLRNEGKARALVFSPQYGVSRLLPTWAPQGSLLAPGSAPFQSLDQNQRKEWLYTHLYYCGMRRDSLRELLNNRTDDLPLAYFVKSTIFGNERAHLFLSSNSQAIQPDEIEEEVDAYDSFIRSFSREQVLKRPIAYAVALADEAFDFSQLDRWYERDQAQRAGAYNLYSLKVRE